MCAEILGKQGQRFTALPGDLPARIFFRVDPQCVTGGATPLKIATDYLADRMHVQIAGSVFQDRKQVMIIGFDNTCIDPLTGL